MRYWIALSRMKGIQRRVRGLAGSFTGPEEVFAAAGSDEGVDPALAKEIRGFRDWDSVDRELDLLDEKGIRVVAFDDSDYPDLLKEIDDPPCILYARGRFPDEALPTVAVVGTRRPTPYGRKTAEALSESLASAGVVVVSGMARGCDSYAHKGALSAGGLTVAVLGTGVDRVYPGENNKLYDSICEKGLVLSEFPPGTPPFAGNFPRRNRIISGLSLGVVVVEAPTRSGSLMTARLSLEYNREVFAVPGPVTSAKSTGTNYLIKQGAALVEDAGDVMEGLAIISRAPAAAAGQKASTGSLTPDQRLVWGTLDPVEPVHIDGITERTGLAVARVSTVLLEMELKGLVEQHPGKTFIRSN